MTKGESKEVFKNANEAINASYKQKIYDEEFVPAVIQQSEVNGVARVQPGDSVIFTNYRPDRARQITKAFVLPGFNKFNRTLISNMYFATMASYDKDLPVKVVFEKDTIQNPIAKVLSEQGLTQLHIAETEKYAHVTYFFNGGKDKEYKGQENKIIPSSGIASYAQKPEMSAPEITKQIISSMQSGKHQFIVVNFANADMVGHTGNLQATMAAIQVIDSSLKLIVSFAAKKGGISVITADHGNAEEMVNWEDGHIIKEHSTNPVPCTIVGEQFKLAKPKQKTFVLSSLKVVGVLSDVTPTILNIIGVEAPEDMTSRSLV
jgi:2,3-bisphosphoglycerate-independent phosphoglycerate mutase